MPECEKPQTVPPYPVPREDVDDLIFRAGPGWLVSDR